MKKLFFPIMALLLAAAVSAQELTAVVDGIQVELEVASGISERMPTGMAASFGADVGKVFAWCRVTGAADTTSIRHMYYYNGEEMATVDLPVKSPSWRTWSSKDILPQWVGDWEVKVFNASGSLLAAKAFSITASAPIEPPPAEIQGTQTTGQ